MRPPSFRISILGFLVSSLIVPLAGAADEALLPGVKRIVFLGDSITHAGPYVDDFTAYLTVRFPDREFEVLNLGLPSETVSGLSEPGHADGKFPRPNLHERLDRVLAKTKPDLVIACYGMNDGIYQPYTAARFEAFRKGILLLRQKVEAAGAQIILLTPPTFDNVPIAGKTAPRGARGFDKPFEHYNDTLGRYSEWLLDQRAKGWVVFDVHGPMDEELAERRAGNPDFRYAGDGVHPNAAGHWIIARSLLGGLNQPTDNFTADARYTDLIRLVRERGRILTDAWLTDTGHQRPGLNQGLPLDEAKVKAAELDAMIKEAAAPLIANP
jgi:lysophospholipase L1-like esterase